FRHVGSPQSFPPATHPVAGSVVRRCTDGIPAAPRVGDDDVAVNAALLRFVTGGARSSTERDRDQRDETDSHRLYPPVEEEPEVHTLGKCEQCCPPSLFRTDCFAARRGF